MATDMTGSGNTIDSSRIGCEAVVNVSPVVVSFNPTSATISPAWGFITGFPFIGVHLQDSRRPFFCVFCYIINDIPTFERSRVDAAVDNFRYVWVPGNLER